MLVELSVRQIAVIESADLMLGPGFTVLSGETGAGKSLLIDAIGLALGNRADSDLLRTGASRGQVSLIAEVGSVGSIVAFCTENGLDLEDGRLTIQRELSAEGRSVCRINGRTQPVSVLRALGALLVDMHGQHDHQVLLDPDRHQDYLDLWIGAPLVAPKQAVTDTWQHLAERRNALRVLQQSVQHRAQRLDFLAFQIQELTALAPVVGEVAALETQISRLKNVERLSAAAFEAREGLFDSEGAAHERLASATAQLEALRELDPTLDEPLNHLRTALFALEDAQRSLTDYSEGIESHPELLDEALTRLDDYRRLLKKYGPDEAALLAHLAEAEHELATLTDAEQNTETLQAEIEAAEASFRDACARLSAVRREFAGQFEAQTQDELRELAMEHAQFRVEIVDREPDSGGADRVTYLFSANPGEDPRPLHKIASGGEMSRVMLSLKVVLAGKAGVPSLIFDEIDAGLSGRAAAIVARKLQDLSRFYQVITISHLPQLAGRASTHYKIEKQLSQGRTRTEIRGLDSEERVVEIARMLAGEQIGESALANARELLSPLVKP